jgi:hypothetical protein
VSFASALAGLALGVVVAIGSLPDDSGLAGIVFPALGFALGSLVGGVAGCWVWLSADRYDGAGATALLLAVLGAGMAGVWLALGLWELVGQGAFLALLFSPPPLLAGLALAARGLALAAARRRSGAG